MKKLTLQILISLFSFACFISCDYKPIKINFEYPTYRTNLKSSHLDTTTIHLFFWYEFNSEIVKIKLNGKEIYKKELLDNNMPCTADFDFKKEKKNLVQIYINGKKTEEFEFDNKYDCGVIIWNSQKNELNLTYEILDGMVGFD